MTDAGSGGLYGSERGEGNRRIMKPTRTLTSYPEESAHGIARILGRACRRRGNGMSLPSCAA